MTQPLLDFDVSTLTVAPSPHPAARETSALAAVANLPRRATQNAQVLVLITAAGASGLSDEELRQATGIPRHVLTLRRHDLRTLITVADRRAVSPSGRAMCCWRRRTDAEMEAR